jgi:hypothetical protein
MMEYQLGGVCTLVRFCWQSVAVVRPVNVFGNGDRIIVVVLIINDKWLDLVRGVSV